MTQGVSSPALTGNAARMDVGGQIGYSDGLWNNHLIGDFSSRGLPDYSHTIVPSVHNFTYDVSVLRAGRYRFPSAGVRYQSIREWPILHLGPRMPNRRRESVGNLDNAGQKWHPTGIPCNPVSNSWNHLVIQVQRTSANHLLFQSITLNGKTWTLITMKPQLQPIGMASRSTISRTATTNSSHTRFGWTT